MIFEKGFLYHIYNQGNNKQKLFYNENNYIFFLKKIKDYILPYADILAYCLMPNHFHLMVIINEIELSIKSDIQEKYYPIHKATRSHPVKNRSLNNSIAILLRSYTRSINKQEGRSGALFRESTKAECVNSFHGMTPTFLSKYGSNQMNNISPEIQYPQRCFNYIHKNPVKANLVAKEIDWKFSSALDYAQLRNGTLINKNIAKEFVDF
jgi:putative transposase